MSDTIITPKATPRRRTSKGLPKRLQGVAYKARKARYLANHTRERNRAYRIVRCALRSQDPRKTAVNQAKQSKLVNNIDWTTTYVDKLLKRRGL